MSVEPNSATALSRIAAFNRRRKNNDFNKDAQKTTFPWLWYISCVAIPVLVIISMYFIFDVPLRYMILAAIGTCFAMSFVMLIKLSSGVDRLLENTVTN